ncbi:unnamed protein product [Brassicogethes aeneus]|uniref:Right handed beta helix domain-containing protein n=1 Tax=Brassicogethes aeneus TaxID=1431903 RepID=A0A9P0B3Z2_BRAAE|nr:unnamed protein product [Brassicogethes aeneus]
MEEVIRFDKSLQERLTEFRDLLPDNLTAANKEWSFYLELTLDPNGWQAVWKIPRTTCKALKIPFPSIILVFVLDVDFKELTALVKVLAVEDDDIHIHEQHRVPLVQLWVTKEQDESIALNLPSTANAVDILRFFYTKLLMPWDLDEHNADWKEKHLEPRLRLYYDMKNGIIPRATAEHIASLLTEARRIQNQREILEDSVSDVDNENELFENKNIEKLMELHVRLLEIKSELDILEDPLLRKVIVKRQSEEVSVKHTSEKLEFWLVYKKGLVDDYLGFLNKVKSDFGSNTPMTFVSNLGNILEIANVNSTFILCEGSHEIRTTGALETGGRLIGISDGNSTELSSERDDIMLDFIGNNVELKNMTIQAGKSQCGIVIRKGKVTLENVKLVGDGVSSTQQGIIVLAGAELELKNCKIEKFSTAVVGNTNSSIFLRNTEIHNVNFGLKIFDNCYVTAENFSLNDCKNYGIVYETEKNLGNNKEKNNGKFDLLQLIPHIKVDHITGNNNIKGDVVISQKSKINPIRDLFANPEFDCTICEEGDSEMSDNFNVTVVENNISPVL